MKKRNILALLLTAALALSLCACGSQSGQSLAPAEEPAPEAVPAPQEPAAEETEPVPEAAAGLSFSTTDREDNAWDESCFQQAELTMINFWEPWCPPCVGEMPDLEKLYQDYREQGFLILGVYGTPGMEDEVDAVLAETGVSYPILHFTEAFEAFQTGYVPTTIFVDSQGHILRREADAEILGLLREVGLPNAEELAGIAFVGGKPYEGWEAVVLEAFGAVD